jgi:ribonuclease HI
MRHLLYCDGSCLGNPGRGGWAFLVTTTAIDPPNNASPAIYSGAVPNTTNNRMELLAAYEALKYAKSHSLTTPIIRTDSKYLCLGITTWLTNWKQNNWRTSSKTGVKNTDLWQPLDHLTTTFSVQWEWVKGHDALNPLHNAVDRAARNAAASLSL